MSKHKRVFIFSLLLVALLIPGCNGEQLTATSQPAAVDTPEPSHAVTFPPETTPTEILTVPYVHLRVEFLTTSDWANLVLLNGDLVLCRKYESITGETGNYWATLRKVVINQPLEAAEEGLQYGVVLDYAFKPEALTQPLSFELTKGDLNSSEMRISAVMGDEVILLTSIQHNTEEPKSDQNNTLPLKLDLREYPGVQLSEKELPSLDLPKMVWAFYYPWYGPEDWESDILTDRPVAPYASNDPEVITRQIEQAQGAGIDGFISSWWGPGDYTDQNLQTLLDLAQEKDFAVTIYFETLTGEGPLSEEEIYKWLAYAIEEYRDHPAFYKVDGKPLIVLWASLEVPHATWQQIFDRLESEGLEAFYLGKGLRFRNLGAFDGFHEYGIFTDEDLAGTYERASSLARYFSMLDDEPQAKLWAATVQPGYDDRLIPGREGLFQDRLKGDFYRQTFEAALVSQPDWIFITSWNEWWEHTYIEPSENFGELYLQITLEYTLLWKGE